MVDEPRLTALSHGAGCACKLSLDELTAALDGLVTTSDDDLLVGHATGDDAAAWRIAEGRVLVATTDFFTPLVDDEETWGAIAAANAVSDVYAMGARPLFALNLVGWPRALPTDRLQRVLAGAGRIAATAGYAVVGGHSIDSQEPLYGQAVVGEVAEERLLTNAGAQVGQALVLTKPIGTGIVTTAVKRSDPRALTDDPVLAGAYDAAVAEMTRLNAAAATAAAEAGATAATDVTGFGLLGHLHRLLSASGVAAELDPARVPLLPGVVELRDRGAVPGGTQRNVEQSAPFVVDPDGHLDRSLLCDAQTSGGLLFTAPPAAAAAAVDQLRAGGHTAALIGEVIAATSGTVRAVTRGG